MKKVNYGYLNLKGSIEINLHREIEGKILFATISKSTTGNYYVSITCEVEYIPFEKTNTKVGIDTGIKDLAILSDGKVYENIKTLKTNLKKLKYNQRQLSKKIKGSNSRIKTKIKTCNSTRKSNQYQERQRKSVQKSLKTTI